MIRWPIFFWFLFSFLIFIFNCFQLQKSIEKSFLVQKIWKNYEKYFWLFSFWFLFFHNLILCFGIFYKFYTYLICLKCLKILLYIFKFWKNYGMIQWYCDKYWWPHLFFISDFGIFLIIFSLFYSFLLILKIVSWFKKLPKIL